MYCLRGKRRGAFPQFLLCAPVRIISPVFFPFYAQIAVFSFLINTAARLLPFLGLFLFLFANKSYAHHSAYPPNTFYSVGNSSSIVKHHKTHVSRLSRECFDKNVSGSRVNIINIFFARFKILSRVYRRAQCCDGNLVV